MPSPNSSSNSPTANRILDAAQSVMESDPSRFSVEVVSRSAGLSRQTVYRHFGSSQALRNSVAHRQDQQFLSEIRQRFSVAEGLADAMRETVTVALRLYRPLSQIRQDSITTAMDLTPSTTLIQELFAYHAGPAVPAHTVQSAADTFMRLIASYVLAPEGLTDRQVADRITAVVLPAVI